MPKVARWFANVIKRTKILFAEIKNESGLDQLINEADDIRNTVNANENAMQDTLKSVKRELDNINSEISQNINEAKQNTFRRDNL